jgi:hypothetical protein
MTTPEATINSKAIMQARQSEKRKVGSSTLPLTTSFRLVSSAVTSADAYWASSCPCPLSDHDCPCVTVVSLSLSHVDRTPCLHAPGLGRLRPELAALFGRSACEKAVRDLPSSRTCDSG